MTRRRALATPRYELNPTGIVLYFALFALAAAAGIGYVEPDLRFFDAVIPGFYSHASNLLLSLLLILIVGLVRLLYGASLRELAVFAAVVAAANLFYEGFLTLYNTMDLVDGAYGVVGAALAFALLAAIKTRGLRRRPLEGLTR